VQFPADHHLGFGSRRTDAGHVGRAIHQLPWKAPYLERSHSSSFI
jgi:hypothetical protein